MDSSGGRRSANRSAGRTKPFISDNDDSVTFGGTKGVGESIILLEVFIILVWIIKWCQVKLGNNFTRVSSKFKKI